MSLRGSSQTDPSPTARRSHQPRQPRRSGRATELDELIEALERAGVHGHGGAFFPTATKLRAVASQRRAPVIIVNGSEGEPLSHKDRFLLTAQGEEVLDGVITTASALGAQRIIIAIGADADARSARRPAGAREPGPEPGPWTASGPDTGTTTAAEATIDAVRHLIREHPRSGVRGTPTPEVVAVPSGFVTGQSTALINVLGGGPARPTTTPPHPFIRGLDGRPTLVSNVETFAQIARVAAGRYDASRLVTVSGAVARITVVRVGPETTVGAALSAAGGITDHARAVLLGGYGGTWSPTPEALGLALDELELRARGLTLGAGIIHVLGASRCGVAEVARITRWMTGQSAGQCGPCVFGLEAITGALEDLWRSSASTNGGPAALERIERWCAMVNGRGGCAHPDGVIRFVTSALDVFAREFSAHAAGTCERCAQPRTPRTATTGALTRPGLGDRDGDRPVLAA